MADDNSSAAVAVVDDDRRLEPLVVDRGPEATPTDSWPPREQNPPDSGSPASARPRDRGSAIGLALLIEWWIGDRGKLDADRCVNRAVFPAVSASMRLTGGRSAFRR